MESIKKKCTICSGELEEGFILDFMLGNQTASRWVEGQPERLLSDGVAYSDRANFHLAAYRCEVCKHVEFYADKEVMHSFGGRYQ